MDLVDSLCNFQLILSMINHNYILHHCNSLIIINATIDLIGAAHVVLHLLYYHVLPDVNECEEIPGLCSHECRNTFGGYNCLCRQGYTLLRDGHSCEDWRCKPNCVNGGRCVKNKCLCPEGFSGIICQFSEYKVYIS